MQFGLDKPVWKRYLIWLGIVKKEIKQRLAESIETSLNISNGLVFIENLENKKKKIQQDVKNINDETYSNKKK